MEDRRDSGKIRVLVAIGSLDRGGAETWLLHMVRNVDPARFRLDVMVDCNRTYAYTADVVAAGCRVLPCLDYRRPWVYRRNFKRLVCEYGPYDILHSHVHYYSGVVLTLGKWAGIPVRIVHVHPAVDLKAPSLTRLVYRRAMFALLRYSATHLLACSETSLRAAIDGVGYRMPCRRVMYNAVDTRRFNREISREKVRRELGLPTDLPIISYVARFFPHKNHRQVIRVAERINFGKVIAHFALAGSHGPELDAVRRAAASRSDVSVLVGLEDISSLLLASDVFVLPSLEEGFGVVAVEAQSAGLPVVAARWDTIKEACAPSHRDLMFEPDSDDALIVQLTRVLSDAALRERLAADGRAWADRFSIQASASALQAVYGEAVAAARATSVLANPTSRET